MGTEGSEQSLDMITYCGAVTGTGEQCHTLRILPVNEGKQISKLYKQISPIPISGPELSLGILGPMSRIRTVNSDTCWTVSLNLSVQLWGFSPVLNTEHHEISCLDYIMLSLSNVSHDN